MPPSLPVAVVTEGLPRELELVVPSVLDPDPGEGPPGEPSEPLRGPPSPRCTTDPAPALRLLTAAVLLAFGTSATRVPPS